jgi:hypothetical protein
MSRTTASRTNTYGHRRLGAVPSQAAGHQERPHRGLQNVPPRPMTLRRSSVSSSTDSPISGLLGGSLDASPPLLPARIIHASRRCWFGSAATRCCAARTGSRKPDRTGVDRLWMRAPGPSAGWRTCWSFTGFEAPPSASDQSPAPRSPAAAGASPQVIDHRSHPGGCSRFTAPLTPEPRGYIV